MKKKLALFLATIMVACVFFACAPTDGGNTPTPPLSNDPGTTDPSGDGPKSALGNSNLAVYRALYGSEFTSLNYLISGTQWDHYVGANGIDSLIEYDAHGNIKSGLAERWENSEDGLTWTFHLRQGAYWYDYQGNQVAEVTANDFVAAAKYVMSPEYESSTFNQIAVLKNANAYYNGEITDFSQVGVKAVDNYTLEYTLETPVPYFLSCLTYVCFLPAYGPQLEELGAEFATSNDKMYYCGAYILTEYIPQQGHTYEKNYLNWDADNVFITKIERTYNSESATLGPELVLRGEMDYTSLSADLVTDWSTNHPEYISMDRVVPNYSYFYTFCFNPSYDESFGPENWRIAVNNSNFRHAIMSAFDRSYSAVALEAELGPEFVQTSINPRGFSAADGTDFADLPPFADNAQYYFDSAKALEYKAVAMQELAAAGATFPVKMVVTYRPDYLNWENETILLEQQIESVLGTDFIDVIPLAGPSENFLSETRRAGKYSFMKTNWGADYQDPETWTDPFKPAFVTDENNNKTDIRKGNSYNMMDLYLDDTNETGELLRQYYALVDAAKAITAGDAAYERYVAFAEAEAFLIKNAFVIPYNILSDNQAYIATKLDVFEGSYAPFGISVLRYKGQTLGDTFVDMDTYQARYDAWVAGQ